jgi:hypothetical protein
LSIGVNQAGGVDIDEILALRSVSGLAGLTGAVFFVGEVDKDGFVGDLNPEEEVLTVD